MHYSEECPSFESRDNVKHVRHEVDYEIAQGLLVQVFRVTHCYGYFSIWPRQVVCASFSVTSRRTC